MKFERDKVYKTRDGKERRVVCVDAPGRWPIISIPNGLPPDGCSVGTETHTEDGLICAFSGALEGADLLLPKPKPREFVLRGGGPHQPAWLHEGEEQLGDGEEIRVREVLPDEP